MEQRRATVLIVDDDEINRDILRSFLEGDYDILEASDGQEALDVLTAHTDEIEGILLDLVMPRMDGFAFMERYGREERWQNIPVLIAAGDERLQTENKCLEAGAWDFLRKPFNPATVNLRLKNSISRRRLAEMQRRRVKDTFSRYMEPAVVEALLRDGVTDEDFRGKSMEVAVLFVDIRGFTSLSEQLEAEKVVEILNRFLTLTSDAIQSNGGTLDKFIGDCTMAFWGAPLPCKDKAYLACRAAMDMLEKAPEFAAYTRGIYGQDVAFSVGIHMGTAVVGSFGAPNRKDYTAIGDTVNTASRLESIAPPGKIYISKAVAEHLGGRAEVTSLGRDIQLKGKKGSFEVLVLNQLWREEDSHG